MKFIFLIFMILNSAISISDESSDHFIVQVEGFTNDSVTIVHDFGERFDTDCNSDGIYERIDSRASSCPFKAFEPIRITIRGTNNIYTGFNNSRLFRADRYTILQWGKFQYISLGIHGGEINERATDVPDFSNLRRLGLFTNATGIIENAHLWDMSNASSMSNMFENSSVEIDFQNWDVSNVGDFKRMFYNARDLNPNIQNWEFRDDAIVSDMFYLTGLSQINYDRALSAFYKTHNGQGINLGTVHASYCRSEEDREFLINERGWNIIDRGKDCTDSIEECIYSNGLENSSNNTQCGITDD
ncbi:BspA family leucine-rich repeat surface protein [Marinicella sp. W31]|uniref:BspA family leucine-rich repeat surface protein n=1 Tax=Marinicella sp. W31 TaxID=3023713 RepID=UPI003757891A